MNKEKEKEKIGIDEIPNESIKKWREQVIKKIIPSEFNLLMIATTLGEYRRQILANIKEAGFEVTRIKIEVGTTWGEYSYEIAIFYFDNKEKKETNKCFHSTNIEDLILEIIDFLEKNKNYNEEV